ncbi:hypothetical protein Y032_0105g3661 [Ancylostoma ceylanicum]|uniref:Uncharacterized protein n=1 Tax=Ancylostoma ceylanicum TaxID=53326 RepID=A0A016TGB8_9BILA|nr:hypothetical protein Y032_0105g3661 [Ancylostoma ceylanicum]
MQNSHLHALSSCSRDCRASARNVAIAGGNMWAILFVTSVLADSVLAENLCEDRCGRIYQRSLARFGFDDEKLRNLLDKQRPLGTVKDICWRVHDHLDCMHHCGDSPEHEKFAKYVRSKCRFALRGLENALSCVSRYHSFMEVRCSTFLKEAERLKSLADPSYTPSQEICRYLHLNTLCLENTVTMYCASAKKIFRRLNFRDYFPNFILPSNDTLFDDLDLDACQMFDFVKKNVKMTEKQIDEELTTVINDFEKDAEVKRLPLTTVSTSTDRMEFTTLLKELLDESNDVNVSSTVGSVLKTTAKVPTTWAAPVLKNSLTSIVFPPSTITRKSLPVTTRRAPLAATSTRPAPTTRLYPSRIITTPKKATTTTSSTTTTTSTSTTTTMLAPNTTTELKDEKNYEEDEYEDEENSEDYDDGKSENVSVEVVQIQSSVTTAARTNVTEAPQFSTRSRLFSDDSWEQPPPNFGYSSMRFTRPFRNGGVTPLNIDTSTLFGMDDDIKDEEDEQHQTDEKKQEPVLQERRKEAAKNVSTAQDEKDVKTTEATAPLPELGRIIVTTSTPRRISSTTSTTTRIFTATSTTETEASSENPESYTHSPDAMTPVTPLLHGDVIVRRIHEWDDAAHSREIDAPAVKEPINDDELLDHYTASEPIKSTETSPEIGNTTVLPRSNIDWSDRETLILIYSLLFAIAIFSLMCALICFIWCRKKRRSHDFKTTY